MAEPIRTCVGCRKRSPKRALLRFVTTADGKVKVDKTGKMSGRGAYVCPTLECVDAAMHAKKLQRPLRCQLSDITIAELKDELAHTIQQA